MSACVTVQFIASQFPNAELRIDKLRIILIGVGKTYDIVSV